MKLLLALISPRRAMAQGPCTELVELYLKRCAPYASCTLRLFASEAKLLDSLEDTASRTRPVLWLCDSRGQQASSKDLAEALGFVQDSGTQQLVLAIGGADGWSPSALQRADKKVAFGRITLPHELAAVVAAEQIYRALTIRAGHPYHSGH